MGTDIHLSWQIKKNGKWEVVEKVLDEEGRACLDMRSYVNFALLAGVRQGYGDDVEPIAPNRGFPRDMAGIEDAEDYNLADEAIVQLYQGYIYGKFGPYYRERPDAWLGYHDFTWVSLKDLIDYPHWHKKRTRVGWITPEMASELGANDTPEYWWTIPVGDAMEKRTWHDTLAEVSYIYKQVIPAMQKLADDNFLTPDAVRVVMGFDS